MEKNRSSAPQGKSSAFNPTASLHTAQTSGTGSTSKASSTDSSARSSGVGITQWWHRFGVQANAAFNEPGQLKQARQQLQNWGHSADRAAAITQSPDYPFQHALVFGHLLSPPPFSLLTRTPSDKDLKALHDVCQTWFKAGDPVLAFQLICAVFEGRPDDTALLHKLLSGNAQAAQTLISGFDPEVAKHLAPVILQLAKSGWANPENPSVFVNPTLRDALEKLVQNADSTQWMHLCLITAQQRAHGPRPPSEPQAKKHMRRMEELFKLVQQDKTAPPEWRDQIVRCALDLAARCPNLRDRARQLQADHEALQFQPLTEGMADWLQLDISEPTDLVTPRGLNAVNVNTETLAQLAPSLLDSARQTFRAWLMLQAQSPQGLDRKPLDKVVHAVAGSPPSPDWVPLDFGLQLTLTQVQRDLARGNDSVHHLLRFLAQDPAGFSLDAQQLAQILALIQHPGVPPLARYSLLNRLLSWLPPLATAPLLHKTWLSTVLSPSTQFPEDLRYTLIDERYRTHEPSGIDEPRTRELHENLRWCRDAAVQAGTSSDNRAALVTSCIEHTQAPAPNTDWTVWRALASAWLSQIANLQNLQDPAEANTVVTLIQTLAQPDASRPHEWVPRLAELLSDTLEHLPPEQRLSWLRALDEQATPMFNAQWPAKTAFPVALAALCGAVRALIDAHSDPAPPPLDEVFATSSHNDNPRLLELLRRYAAAVLANHAGDVEKAEKLIRATHSTMRLSVYDQSPLPKGLYELFDALRHRYRLPADQQETPDPRLETLRV